MLGHREYVVYYNQSPKRTENALVVSLMKEYRIMQAKREQYAKLPDYKYMKHQKQEALRVGLQGNKLLRLRFRPDNPL